MEKKKEFPKIIVQPGEVLVCNLPFGKTTDDVEKEFARFGAIKGIEAKLDRRSKIYHGCMFIRFEQPESADEAIQELDGKELFGRVITVKQSEIREDRKHKAVHGGELESRTVFVMNVPYKCTENALETVFSKAGKVLGVRFPKRSGLAYVEFENDEACAKAIQTIDGTIFQNRKLSVKPSIPPKRAKAEFVNK